MDNGSVSIEVDTSETSHLVPAGGSSINNDDDQIEVIRLPKASARTYVGIGANALYSVVVSFVFAKLAANEAKGDIYWGTVYFVSSLGLNLPMAFEFASQMAHEHENLKVDPTRRKTIALGLATGLFTSLVGLPLANDGLENGLTGGIKNKYVKYFVNIPLIGTFWFNTFSTRVIGTANLFNDLFLLYREFSLKIHSRYRSLIKLHADIQRYKDRVDVPLNGKDADSMEDFIDAFYGALNKENINPPSDMMEYAILGTQVSLSLFLVFLAFNMTPLFLRLGQRGLLKLVEWLGVIGVQTTAGWSQQVGVAYPSAVSNLGFYAYSAATFSRKMTTVASRYVNRRHLMSKTLRYGLPALFAVYSGMAYFSGTGYRLEAEKAQCGDDCENGGFGVGSTWNDAPGTGDSYNLISGQYPLLVQIMAGLVANGGAAAMYLMNKRALPVFPGMNKFFGEDSVEPVKRGCFDLDAMQKRLHSLIFAHAFKDFAGVNGNELDGKFDGLTQASFPEIIKVLSDYAKSSSKGKEAEADNIFDGAYSYDATPLDEVDESQRPLTAKQQKQFDKAVDNAYAKYADTRVVETNGRARRAQTAWKNERNEKQKDDPGFFKRTWDKVPSMSSVTKRSSYQEVKPKQ